MARKSQDTDLTQLDPDAAESDSAGAQPSDDQVQPSQPTPLSLQDEYQGHGGTYLLDPATGVRTWVAH